MPIEYRIDHERRLVIARAHGQLEQSDFFAYQREVWSRPEVQGYDELADMRDAEFAKSPSADNLRQLAMLSAAMDLPSQPSKFAIVATQDWAFGLGRMYETYRELSTGGTKLVKVFRNFEDACKFLGVEGLVPSCAESSGAPE